MNRAAYKSEDFYQTTRNKTFVFLLQKHPKKQTNTRFNCDLKQFI